MKRLIILGMAVIIVFGMLPTQPAVGIVCDSSIVVTNTNDSGAGSLRQAIVDVCPDGTITFDASLSGATIGLSSSLSLARNMTIDGSSLPSRVILSGGGVDRVFLISDGYTVTLNSLVIADGKVAGDGGGIYNGTGTLTLLNSILINNEGNKPTGRPSWGGGIYNGGGHLEVINSRLDSNQTNFCGGGIFNNAGTVMVQNSILASNSTKEVGGGVFNGYGGTLTIVDSTLSQNVAKLGGGIYNEGNTSTVSISGNTFKGNIANTTIGVVGGGGIYNLYGSVTVTNSTFSGNASINMFGAAIMNFGTLSLISSTLSGNLGATTLHSTESQATLNYANTIIANTPGGEDCYNDTGSVIVTNINNLVEDGSWSCNPSISGDPMLETLADRGGPTWTMALEIGSPAIDAGDDSTCAAAPVIGIDQRGAVRPAGCDIGAYEYSGVIPHTPPPVIAYHDDITVSAESAAGEVVTYTSPAVWNIDSGPGTASCAPVSGLVFSPGTTIVTCMFEDAAENQAAPTTFAVRVVDGTPPVIGPHDDVNAEATSATGAIVTYTSPATSDTVDGLGTASCTPLSGSQFSLGDTVVTCTAQDTAGNQALPTNFSVHVVDATPPVIALHEDVTVEATSASGAIVTYTSPATSDAVDGPGTASCTPLSGSQFIIGGTVVTCTASDAAGNDAAPTTFTVTVEPKPLMMFYLPLFFSASSN